MENSKIAKFYKDVPEESLAKLLDFRHRYPYQTYTINGITWRYIDTQEGESAVFIPAGGTTITEISFQSLAHFAQTYRVITPDYPPINNIKDLFEGFIGLMDHLGIDKFSVMGGSYGGWMVQSFVRAYPQRITKVVLTAIGPPNPENSAQIAKMKWMFKIIPMFLFRAMINRSFSRLDSSRKDGDMLLAWAHVKEVLHTRVGRADLLSAMMRLVDQTDNYTFTPQDLKDWPGQILIVCGSEDPSTPLEKRQALKELYPQAEMKVFEGGEHGIAISHQQEYFAVIDEFLSR